MNSIRRKHISNLRIFILICFTCTWWVSGCGGGGGGGGNPTTPPPPIQNGQAKLTVAGVSSGTEIQILLSDGSAIKSKAVADKSGKVIFQNLEKGSYMISCKKRVGYRACTNKQVTVNSDISVDYPLTIETPPNIRSQSLTKLP